MQVVGSSRISNTVYLGVASIYWTLYITLSEFQLNLDVQTVLLLITPPAGIAAILWILRIEEIAITKFLLIFLSGYNGGISIRYYMGYSIIHLQPWKEYFFDLDKYRSISKSLNYELTRVFRTPQMKEEIESLHQLFWLLFSIPGVLTLLNLSLLPQYMLGIILTSLLIDLVLVIIIMVRKRSWPARILGLSFCIWMTDTINTMNRRRNLFSTGSSERFPLRTPQYYPNREPDSQWFIEKLEPWVSELMTMAKNEDWMGFEKNMAVFIETIDSLYKQENRLNLINSLVNDVIWSIKRKKVIGPIPTGVTVDPDMFQPIKYRAKAEALVLDSFSAIDRMHSFRIINGWMNLNEEFVKGWKSLSDWENLYKLVTLKMMQELTENTIEALAELPFFLDNPNVKLNEICKLGGSKQNWTLNIILCLQNAIDRDLISPDVVFDVATRWGIVPRDYIEQCSFKIKCLILEVETNLPLVELKYVIRKVIHDCNNLDYDKVASNLLRYKNDSEFLETIDIIRDLLSRPEKPHAVRAKAILEKMGINYKL